MNKPIAPVKKKYKVAIIDAAPFYYHLPLYRSLQDSPEIDSMVYYCSDETVRGVEVEKLYKTKGKLAEDDLLEGYKYQFLKNYSLNPSYIHWPLGLVNLGICKEIIRGNYDIVILQSWSNLTWWLAFLTCLFLRIPVFFTTDANILCEDRISKSKRRVKKILLGGFIFRRANGFLISGTTNKQFYQSYGVPEAKMVKLPHWWGFERFLKRAQELQPARMDIRKSLGINENELVLLFIGRLAEDKNLNVLLDAYHKVKHPNKKLFIVGDGPLRHQLEQKVKDLKIKGVFFAGFQARKDISNFYTAADIFILPSKIEPWGMVVNEAMCFSLPIIASDRVGAAIDLVKVGYNGCMFKVGDVNELTSWIEKIMGFSHEERRLYGSRSKEIITEWIESIDPVKQVVEAIHLTKKHRMNFIKKLSYNAAIIKTIRFLHLREVVRKIYFYWAKPKNSILDVSIAGQQVKYYVRTPDELRLAESVSGQWGEKPVIEALAKTLNPGDSVFDVGANIGIYSIVMAKVVGKAGRVIAFEPENESYDRLRDNAKINDLANVQNVKKALGEKNETVKLYIGKTTGNFSLLKLYEEGIKFQEVSLVNGDELVVKEQLPIPTAVKIDVEGYEYSVLKGLENTLRNPACKIICCEVHPGLFPDGITEEVIMDFIKSLGFSDVEYFKRAFSAYHVIAKKP